MGWNFCIATESDRERYRRLLNLVEPPDEDYDEFYAGVNSLSRQFSYALFRDGLLQKGLDENEVEAFSPDGIDDPEQWQPRDPQQLLEIFRKVKERLGEENEQMPVDHFLWYVDEQGRRCGGSTQITLPYGGIEMKVPHPPMVKLDGGHHDLDHRWELRQYDVHIDPELLAQSKGFSFLGFPGINPIVEVPMEWIPVRPVLEVLSYRVEVESINSLSSFQPDLDLAIHCCEEAIRLNTSFYWLME